MRRRAEDRAPAMALPRNPEAFRVCRGGAAMLASYIFAGLVVPLPLPPASAQQTAPAPPAALVLPSIEVVGVTPVLGTAVPVDQVPSNVQTLTAPQLENFHPWSLPEALQNNLGSVSLSDSEGNPFQIDVDFHGYTASPVLGTPQGLAIYQNGTRINEPFGDVVYWDFVPLYAIEKLQLIPGSNPVFGLNALGGAVTLQMKTGFDLHGLQTDLSAGSFDRQQAIVQYGVEKEDVAFYTGLMAANDGGWRDFSPSQVLQTFSDLELRKDKFAFGASFTFANNYLAGNGANPEQQLEISRAAAFAIPDTAHDHLIFLQGRGNYQATSVLSFQGTAYYRNSEIYTLNGAASGFGPCTQPGDDFAALCNNPGPGEEPLTTYGGHPIPARVGGSGTIGVEDTMTDSFGGALQSTLNNTLFGHKNTAILGASIDYGSSHFTSATELGDLVYVDPSGTTTVPNGISLGGSAFNIRLDADNRYFGIYGNDTLSLTPALSATLAARLNLADVQLNDLYGNSLTDNDRYRHFNPSAGLTYQVNDGLNIYGNYSVSNRIPTPAELSCANPDLPCRFPLGFVSDPPLQQVVAHTVEIGVRGRAAEPAGGDRLTLDWSADIYGARNENDIIFITSGPLLGSGFFANAGTTQRLGADASVKAGWRNFEFRTSYGFVLPTFRSSLLLPSPFNPGATAGGFIAVKPGDRLPQIPLNSAKIGLRCRFSPAWRCRFPSRLRLECLPRRRPGEPAKAGSGLCRVQCRDRIPTIAACGGLSAAGKSHQQQIRDFRHFRRPHRERRLSPIHEPAVSDAGGALRVLDRDPHAVVNGGQMPDGQAAMIFARSGCAGGRSGKTCPSRRSSRRKWRSRTAAIALR
jgi:outer membrane receptor protein involved in Fe transport